MGAAFRIILIILVVWYLFRIINRYIVPALFGSPKKDKAPEGPDAREFRKSTRQGDVTITDYGQSQKDANSDKDDYVEFEEVE